MTSPESQRTDNTTMNELMQTELDATHGAGVYRVRPIAWTIQESPREGSQSVAIRIAYSIVNEWHPEQEAWSAEWPLGWYVYGSHWIVKRDGSLSAGTVDQLVKAGVWNGDFSVLEVDPPNEVTCLATVEENVYDGNTSFRVNWVDPDADVPRARAGGFKPADKSVLQSLRARFGSQVRAIAGGQPQGKPTAPPSPAAPPAPAQGGPGEEPTPF